MQNCRFVCIVQIQFVNALQGTVNVTGTLFRVKRHVGSEHDMIHTKEINTSSNGRCGAKGSSVRIKLTNRINGRTLHFCVGQLIPQLRRSASAIHLQTIFNTTSSMGIIAPT